MSYKIVTSRPGEYPLDTGRVPESPVASALIGACVCVCVCVRACDCVCVGVDSL